jgi:hypothetical protein
LKIFYCGGVNSQLALLAGAIHLGHLPEAGSKLVDVENKLIEGIGHREPRNWGIPLFLGADCQGNEIYILTLGPDPDMGLQAIYHLLNATGDPTQWKFYKTLSQINPLIRFGVFGVRHLHLELLGRWLIAQGIRTLYSDLVNQVQQIKEWNLIGKT